MVKTVTKKGVTSDWLAWELDGNHRPSRENVTVAPSQTLVDGQVISFNGSNQAVAYTGSGSVAGVFVGEATTGASETLAGVIVARHARIVFEKLSGTGADETAKATTLAGLKTIGITPVRQA